MFSIRQIFFIDDPKYNQKQLCFSLPLFQVHTNEFVAFDDLHGWSVDVQQRTAIYFILPMIRDSLLAIHKVVCYGTSTLYAEFLCSCLLDPPWLCHLDPDTVVELCFAGQLWVSRVNSSVGAVWWCLRCCSWPAWLSSVGCVRSLWTMCYSHLCRIVKNKDDGSGWGMNDGTAQGSVDVSEDIC